MTVATASALFIAFCTMILVGVRPKGIPEWIWAVAGAALLCALRIEPLDAALRAMSAQWNVVLFILGLMGISAAAECSGLFEWVTDVVLERAGGVRRRLFALLFTIGGLLTVVLSNDATAIVFTPVVYRAVAKRGIDALPYLYACTFVADTASFGLPFSNPANLLVIARPALGAYAAHLGPPMLVAFALNLAVFFVLFRKQLRGRYEAGRAEPLTPRARRTLIAMLGVAVAYVAALLVDWPLGPVALGGAFVALAVAGVGPRAAADRIGWPTFVLLAGLFVLLDAVSRVGLVGWALQWVHDAERDGRLVTILGAAFGSALASNVLNNLPVAILSGNIVAHANASPLAYALIAGVDLGPNLTTTGSLATILWLAILRERGVEVRPLEYLRLGLSVVPAMLLVTSLWLWFLH
ncbi:MAG: SLC13 family permease [Candidatus Velthaea sp.]